jgi:signal peptidase
MSAPRDPHPVLWWARAIGGWLVLLVVVAFVAVTVAVPRLTGGTAYTVTSGSMRPSLEVGTLIVTRPVEPSSLGIGDVITFQAVPGRQAVITHRIIGVGYAANGKTTFQTRGDANGAADEKPVQEAQLRGELWYAVPYVGYLNSWVNGSNRPVLLYAVGALLIGYAGWMFVSAARDRRPSRRTEDAGITR